MGNPNDSTVHLNLNGDKSHTYDVIVIGSGMSGAWAAKEFCEKGLKTLVLERGRNVEHVKDYPTATKNIWDFPHRNQLPDSVRRENPIVSRCYAFEESTQHFFVKDKEHPYIQTRPFDWIRGYQVGGKSLLWGRWTQRWNEKDFEANLKDGIAVDWPIRYSDLAPWYSYVEKFVGISGNHDGLEQIPDGEFIPPMEMNCIEKHLQKSIAENFSGRRMIISRTANLSVPHLGRGPCQYRDLCFRGCPYGGYFSSNSATIPAAQKTGNLTIRPFSVVHSILYDDKTQRAKGVRVIDSNTKEVQEYFSKIVFVNAGTINTALILLNSTSARFPNGLGNDCGELGHNLMDHNYNGRIYGEHLGFQDQYYSGRRPAGTYIAKFRNWGDDKQPQYMRGFAFACISGRARQQNADLPPGAELKESLTEAGPWTMSMVGMGECLPDHRNKVTLSKEKKDDWGIPLADIDASYSQNEHNMTKDILNSGAEMLEKAGFVNIVKTDMNSSMGLGIHEMGTARMGRDPKTSVLNAHNQVWGIKNLFVTDGACMTSSACQNPSLTYMAITARAANYAVEELKRGNL